LRLPFSGRATIPKHRKVTASVSNGEVEDPATRRVQFFVGLKSGKSVNILQRGFRSAPCVVSNGVHFCSQLIAKARPLGVALFFHKQKYSISLKATGILFN
jgi:hypothetical protein